MTLKIGEVFYRVRESKNITRKELSSNFLSISHISNIENGKSIPSADRFIYLLSALNIKYEEFIDLLGDDYYLQKHSIGEKLAEACLLENKPKLEIIAKESLVLYDVYHDIHFKFIHLIALAHLEIIKDDNQYTNARKYTYPIKDYLETIEEFGEYELSLFSNCIYLFDITEATKLGTKALVSIENRYHHYRNKETACTLLYNLATYTLDHYKHYSFALKCVLMCEEISYTAHHATYALHAKILKEIVYFKLQNGKFKSENLHTLLRTFELLDWNNEFNSLKVLAVKHDIPIHL